MKGIRIKKQNIKKGACSLLLICSLFCFPVSVFGAKMQKTEEKEILEIRLDKFQAGEDVTESFSPQIVYDETSGQTNLSFQTEGETEGQYALSVFENDKEKLKDYEGVELCLKNNRNEELKMNVLLSTLEETVLIVRDGAKVWLEEKDVYQVKESELGCFTVPANYDGTIYIPFTAFAQVDDTEEPEEITGIYGIGFTFVLPEDSRADVSLSAIRMIPENTAQAKTYFEITGADSVLRPRLGESTANYSVEFYNGMGQVCDSRDAVSYEIVSVDGGQAKGAFIDENGRLTVEPAAAEGTYLLRANSAMGKTAEKEITFKASWTESQKTDNGYDASMVSPDEVTEVVSREHPLMDDVLVKRIRMAVVAIVVIFLGYYTYKHNRYKKEFMKKYDKGGK